MLDVGSPRVFNVNIMTHRIVAKDPAAKKFFRCAPLNNLVLIKDTVAESGPKGASGIGTKLYFPFNENEIYEGGRTIFAHDRGVEAAMKDVFGEGALPKESLAEDLRIISILNRLPSLDPFLMKDVFLNEKIDINPAYFEVSKEVFQEIEVFILARFEPLAKAAFPEAMKSDDVARRLIEKIWEARDLEALKPLILAFQLPAGHELEIFSAWKGVNFYAFQYERMKPKLGELMSWLLNLQIPVAAVSAAERAELKEALEQVKTQLRAEWQTADGIFKDYQSAYDKMFKDKVSSTGFVTFLKNSNKLYWDLGNCLGKSGHAAYCWDVMTKRFAERKLPYEVLKEVINLLAKIFKPSGKLATSVKW